jgi:outer membrane protein TolC
MRDAKLSGRLRWFPSARRTPHAAYGLQLLTFLFAASFLLPAGCTRRFFRHQADKQVEEILTEKNCYPAWKIEQWHVYPDPRARFADFTDPDRPPMPPDDPASRDLSPNPQRPGKAGIGFSESPGYLKVLADWDAANRVAAEQAKEREADAALTPTASAAQAPTLPPPTTLGPAAAEDPTKTPNAPTPEACDPRTAGRPYLINLDQSVELGGFNSREFQDRREDLYLTALPVTLQRFSFAAQYLAAGELVRQWIGAKEPGGPSNNWSTTNNIGVSKLFSTGALLLLDFANRTVVDFANFPRVLSESTATLDLIQPLLRGGGRAVTLEPLTQSERDLLAQIRSYARFRKEFYVSIAGGGGGSITGGAFVPQGVVSNTTVSPGANLAAAGLFPGVIPSVPLAGVSPQQLPGLSGRLNLSKAIPPSAAGYLGTLLQYSQIAIDQENIEALERFLRLFQAFKEGGDVSQLQVDQVEQQLLLGRSTKLTDQQQYGNALDQFKIQLGLPTPLLIELEDTPLRPLTRQFRRFEQVFRQYDEASQASANLRTAEPGRLRAELRRLVQEVPLARGTAFQRDFPARWAEVEKLPAEELRTRLRRIDAERRQLLDRRADLERAGQTLPEADLRRLTQLDQDEQLLAFEAALREYEAQPWAAEANEARRRQMQITRFRIVVNTFDLLMGQARNERLEALRASWPPLPPLCVEGSNLLTVSEDDAFAVASRTTVANRLDLMNARAQLTDSWRQVAVFANSLLGTVNLHYHLGTNTPAGLARPLALGGSRYDNELILDYQAPLVRTAERNNYRAALIAFQRQRRATMEAEDLAVQTVRGEIRQLRVLAENYRIQQRQVELAYLTVENSLDTLKAPPGAAAQQSTAAQAAALTTQLLNAQSRLPAAQNALLTVWINYQNTRLQLYRDLELIPLDARGVWTDDQSTRDCDGPCQRPAPGAEGGPQPERGQPERGRPERLPPPRPGDEATWVAPQR